jgi:Cytochrome c oxidase subunit IV
VSGPTEPGTEGPRGHELRPPVDDRAVPWRVFVFIGAFVGVIGLIYWSTAYEESGVVMLLVAAVLGLWIGAYLWLQQRGAAGPAGDAAPDAGEVTATEGHGAALGGVTEGGVTEGGVTEGGVTEGGVTEGGVTEAGVTEASSGAGASAGTGLAEGSSVAGASGGTGVAEAGEHYLPHASAWPFAIGLGGATVANGLVLGLWVIVPGVALMVLGIGGFVRQTRRRD